MGQNSKIEWTDHTFNPWWGCAKVSDGCKNCYALDVANRFGNDCWGVNTPRKMMSEAYWRQPLKWNKEAENLGVRKRVFCASMADVFEDKAQLVEPRTRLFYMIQQTPHLDWLLLTKRPENIIPSVVSSLIYENGYDPNDSVDVEKFYRERGEQEPDEGVQCWLNEWTGNNPPENVWIGTSVENQETADQRIPELLKVPAKVRFLSCEPLLGALDLSDSLHLSWTYSTRPDGSNNPFHPSGDGRGGWWSDIGTQLSDGPRIDWAICGGESGPNARPMHPDWARSIRDQCVAAGVPFLFKQWGEWAPRHPLQCNDADVKGKEWFNFDPDTSVCRVGKKAAGRILDSRTWDEYPATK